MAQQQGQPIHHPPHFGMPLCVGHHCCAPALCAQVGSVAAGPCAAPARAVLFPGGGQEDGKLYGDLSFI